MTHVRHEAEEHHNRHADAAETSFEQGVDDEELVVERIAGGFDFGGAHVRAAGECGEHEEDDAYSEDGGGRMNFFIDEPHYGRDGREGNDEIEHGKSIPSLVRRAAAWHALLAVGLRGAIEG